MNLSPEIKQSIRAHCYQNREAVSCGLILESNGGQFVYEIENFDSNFFLVSPSDLIRASKQGKIVAVYHSILSKFSGFSEVDIKTSKTLKCPVFVYDFSEFHKFVSEAKKSSLVNITLHGKLGEAVGKTWRLAVNSVGEAIRAIEMNSKRKLFKFLYENDRLGTKYRVLINGKDFLCASTPDIRNPKTIADSELVCHIDNLESIDIVPVIEGADKMISIITLVIGVILIATGVLAVAGAAFLGIGKLGAGIGIGIGMAGLGLVAAGVINLLSRPPQFGDFREIESSQGKTSYLFNGPENVSKEGGPVPLGYGRLLCGSQVVSASYVIKSISSTDLALKYDPGYVDSTFSYNIDYDGVLYNKALYASQPIIIKDQYGRAIGYRNWTIEQISIDKRTGEKIYAASKDSVFVSDSYVYAVLSLIIDNLNTGNVNSVETNAKNRVYHKYLIRKSLFSRPDSNFEVVSYLHDSGLREDVETETATTENVITPSNNPIISLGVFEALSQTAGLVCPTAKLFDSTLQFNVSQNSNSVIYTRLLGKVRKIYPDKANGVLYYVGNFSKSGDYTGLIAKASINGQLFSKLSFGQSNNFDSTNDYGIFDIVKAGDNIIVCGCYNDGAGLKLISVLNQDGATVSNIEDDGSIFTLEAGLSAVIIRGMHFDNVNNYLYVVGDFITNGDAYRKAARMTYNPSTKALALDTSWTCPFAPTKENYETLTVGTINTVTQQASDSKLLFGGKFAIIPIVEKAVSHPAYRGLLRTNQDGSFDTSFNNGIDYLKAGTEGTINYIKVIENSESQIAGEIVIGGTFSSYNGAAVKDFALITNGVYGR